MEKTSKYKILGVVLLLICALSWGSGFVVLKTAIENTPPVFVIGVRFLIATLLLALVFFKKLKLITKKTILRSLLLGAFLGLAYLVQTLGLKQTTPARNAFVTSLYCVLCPFFLAVLFKIKPKAQHVVSAVLCVLGILFISLSSGLGGDVNMLKGDGLTLVSAVFFALQIVYIDRYKMAEDSITLLIVHMFFASVILLLYSACFEINAYGISAFTFSKENLFNLIYLTLVCTLLAQACQIFGLKWVNPNEGALILCLESVFGAIFSLALGKENLTLLLGIGFVLIFLAVTISQVNFSPIKKYSNKNLNK